MTTIDPPLPSDGNWQATTDPVLVNISANDIHQGSLDDCYLEAALLCLAATPGGVAFINSRIKYDAANNRYGVTFTRSGVNTTVEVPDEIASQENLPVDGNTWPDIIETAYADYRTGADTLGSLDYGNPNQFLFDFGYNVAVSQPANVSALIAAAQTGAPAFVMTPPTGQRPDMVADHCYAVLADGKLHNPWGSDQPLLTITDADVLNYGLTLACAAPPPAVTTPTTEPTMPTSPVTFTTPDKNPDGNMESDLSWNFPGAKVIILRGDNLAQRTVSNPGAASVEQWQGPQFYVVVDGVTTTVNPFSSLPTGPPVTPTLGPVATDLAAGGLKLFAAWFAQQYPGV